MAKLMTSEYDYYSLGKNYYNYIHSSTQNFVEISQKENVQKTIDFIREQVKKSVIEELKDAYNFWYRLREDFMVLFQKNLAKNQNWPKGIITDPDEFINQFNIYFKKGTQGTLLSEMVEFKQMSMDFSKKTTKKEALEKYGKDTKTQMNRLISMLRKITKMNDSITREGTERGKKEKILDAYVVTLAKALGSPKGNIKEVIDDLTKGSRSKESLERLIKNLMKKASASALGSLLDGAFGLEKANEVYKNVFKIGFKDQKDFKDKSIVDTITLAQEYDKETLLFGINAKLRRDTKAGSTYALNKKDDQMMGALKKAKLSSGVQSTLFWFRHNILALQTWSRYEAVDRRRWTGKGEKRKELNKEMKDLYYLERDIATYLFVIRGLEVYESGQGFDFKALPSLSTENGLNRFHSVMLFASGEFMWTVDLLDAIILELQGVHFSPKVLTGEPSYNDNFSGISRDLGKLYGQKMRARERYIRNKQKEPVKYSAIISNRRVREILDRLNNTLEDYQLVKDIQIGFNYKSLLRRK